MAQPAPNRVVIALYRLSDLWRPHASADDFKIRIIRERGHFCCRVCPYKSYQRIMLTRHIKAKPWLRLLNMKTMQFMQRHKTSITLSYIKKHAWVETTVSAKCDGMYRIKSRNLTLVTAVPLYRRLLLPVQYNVCWTFFTQSTGSSAYSGMYRC